MSMPEKTAMPITLRASAPAPLAVSSGTTPRMKAKAVIRIGRKRSLAASSAASTSSLPCSCSIFANSTIRIAFFAARPISMIEPDLREDVVHVALGELARDPQAEVGAERGERRAEQHAERQPPALVLRRQDQEDQQDGEREHDHAGFGARFSWYDMSAQS